MGFRIGSDSDPSYDIIVSFHLSSTRVEGKTMSCIVSAYALQLRWR